MSDSRLPRVLVVGGGITGLTCAWSLRDSAEVSLLESDDRVGGKIRTAQHWGVPVESGPDLFLARVPWAVDLCREAGLGGDLVAPATGQASVWGSRGLRPLPPGLMLGVPTQLRPLLGARLLPLDGVLRAGLDLVLPRRQLPSDPSVAEVIGGRFGRTVLEQLVEPLLGGIHAGRADSLSLRAVAPDVADLAQANRSLLVGARRRAATTRVDRRAAGPVFQSVRGGLERLAERLARDLGPRIRTGTRVGSIRRWAEGGLAVDIGDTMLEADAVVLCADASGAAAMLRQESARASRDLAEVRYASVVTTTLAYRSDALPSALYGSGFVVPRVHGRLVTACTFLTSKWPALRESGLVLLRASCGRIDDERALRMDDNDLASAVHRELREALQLTDGPVDTVVNRWPHALPQYEPGHLARIERVRNHLGTDLPGVHLAGAAYGGLGIAACVRQARDTAVAVIDATTVRGRSSYPSPVDSGEVEIEDDEVGT